MDPLVGGLVAAAVAWTSILASAFVPARIDMRSVRLAGGASLLLVGLGTLGLPMPGWLPAAVVATGLAVAGLRMASVRRSRPEAAQPP